ncbi:uncharacterized protein [Parasteatoda tepidariorum]|uniref:uncharacterized protein isoform X2 n=1 Tax=Parasteatoda tepidariorum TaxID=114398 RepID=UPI00077FBF01|nr:uncharacterized protein LOC107444445 isoform X2 [Parasteatoda tepidariorum]
MERPSRGRFSRRTSINVAAMLNPEKSVPKFVNSKLIVFRQLDHSIINDEHRRIFSILSSQFDMSEGDIENYSLSSTKGPQLLKQFSSEMDTVLLFYYKNGEEYTIA